MDEQEVNPRLLEIQSERSQSYGNFKANVLLMRKLKSRIKFDRKSKCNTFIKEMIALKLCRIIMAKAHNSDPSDSIYDLANYMLLAKNHFKVNITLDFQRNEKNPPKNWILNRDDNDVIDTDKIVSNIENLIATKAGVLFTIY